MENIEEVKSLLEKQGEDFEAFKTANDERLDEIKKTGEVSAETAAKVDKLNESIETRDAEIVKREATLKADKEAADKRAEDAEAGLKAAVERMDGLETAMKRPGASNGDDKPLNDPEHTKAFNEFVRRGNEIGLREIEQKALSVGSDPDGGYYVTPEISNRVNTIVRESTPIRQLATVETIGSDSMTMPVDEDEAASGWVGETESRTETSTPTVGVTEIVAHEIYAEPRATQKLLDDAGINVEQWLARKVAEKFARDEATAFVTGDGVARPRGIMTYGDGTSRGTIEQIPSLDADTLTFDGLIDLQNALKEPYLPNAVWLMRRATTGVVRKLKDANGNYLWNQSTQLGVPSLLLGHAVHSAADIAAVTAAALAVAFGDFRTAYTIVDRIGIRVLRDPLTSKPFVKFYTTKRVGGAVVNFEAYKIQDIAAS